MKLSWIDVLNDQTEWTDHEELSDWLYKLTGRKVILSAGAVSAFFDDLTFIREQVTSLHFGEALALDALQQRLEGVSLAINTKYSNDGLPLLTVKPQGETDSAILGVIGKTLILQFAAFLSDAGQNDSVPRIVRCEGVFREGRGQRKRLGALKNEREAAWRAELSLLQESEPQVVEEIQRCEDLFVFSSKAKFCSDACRFTTFQITKQLKDPGYMKEKQRRYRTRKEKH